jgi:hypothetical protein
MKNPNKGIGRIKKFTQERWHAEDYPGVEPRFQIKLFTKDFAIFFLLPITAIFLFKSCEKAFSGPKKVATMQRPDLLNKTFEGQKSQIIDFQPPHGDLKFAGIAKRSPGTLVHVKLMNVVETYSAAPVYAQVIDGSLGKNLIGATLIGEASGDSNFSRINVTFQNVRDPQHDGIAIPIAARALSLDGTFGVNAEKKEGFFARSALNSTGSITQDAAGKLDGSDIKHLLLKALTSGLLQEAGNDAQVQRNRAQVLMLQPNTEFFVELTDYFPGAHR